MQLFIGSVACVALVLCVVAIHDETLQFLSGHFLPHRLQPRRWHVGLTVLILIAAHILEIVVFAFGLYATEHWLQLGTLTGVTDGSYASFLYFSFSSYTSLGIGDIAPHGELRLLAGLESLTGLLMIGWSASFVLLEMREFRAADRRGRRRSG